MRNYRRELLYVSIFVGTLLIVGVAAWQLAQAAQLSEISSSPTACQLVVSRSTQSSQVALATLVTGALAVLLLKLIASAALYHQFTASLVAQQCTRIPKKLRMLCQQHQVPLSQVVVTRERHATALALGAGTPKFIFSTRLLTYLSSRQLEAVLLHELYHARHHHPLVLFIAATISKTLFFVPVLSALAKHMHSEFEFRADQAAVRVQHTTRHLKEAMLVVLQKPAPTPIYAAAFGAQDVEQRLACLATNTSPKFRAPRYSLATTVIVLAAIVFLATPTAAQVKAATELSASGPSCSFFNCVTACMQETLEHAVASQARSSARDPLSPATDHSSAF